MKIIGVDLKTAENSFGGNQGWLADETLRSFGCGLVSCADIILSAAGESRSRTDYEQFCSQLSRSHLKVRKFIGLNGLSMARGLNRIFKEKSLPYKAGWGCRSKKILPEIKRMLGMKIPVCLSVGPSLFVKDGVNFYPEAEISQPVREKINDHYVTVTAVCENDDGQVFLEISSWGKRFFISFSEYMAYKKRIFTFFSDILVVKSLKESKNC